MRGATETEPFMSSALFNTFERINNDALFITAVAPPPPTDDSYLLESGGTDAYLLESGGTDAYLLE